MKGPSITEPSLLKSKEYQKRWRRVNPKPQNRPTFIEGYSLYLLDVDGNRYMNFSYLSVSLGHRNPRVVAAVKEQLEKTGVRIRGPSIPRIMVMENVMRIVPTGLRDGGF